MSGLGVKADFGDSVLAWAQKNDPPGEKWWRLVTGGPEGTARAQLYSRCGEKARVMCGIFGGWWLWCCFSRCF